MQFKFKYNIKREVKIIVAILIVGGIIAFTERRGTASIKDITIKMKNVNENHFLDEDDIVNLMELKKDNLKGAESRSD
jgi:hypothetical protein